MFRFHSIHRHEDLHLPPTPLTTSDHTAACEPWLMH
jgi:hypothetical protein